MPIPDFTRADYNGPRVIEGEVVGVPVRASSAAFPLAIVYGLVAAIAGSIGYGLVASLGVMISIVTIGIGWLVARAMMTATGGIGARPYQIAACLLTYFASTVGELLHPLWIAHGRGMPLSAMLNSTVIQYFLIGPFLELTSSPFNGALGLIIIFIGLRTAWRLAAGTPGFGQPNGPRMTMFGPR